MSKQRAAQDRELTRRFEPRWEEVRLQEQPQQFQPGRDGRPEEGGRAQGR